MVIPELLMRTASALIIICSLNLGIKVRCHMGCVDNARIRIPGKPSCEQSQELRGR